MRAFTQNPLLVSPFTVNMLPAAQSAPLQGVQSFQNFAAILVITDSADTGRASVEQAGPLRGSAPMVVVASSQAGPMLQPYYQFRQINGRLRLV